VTASKPVLVASDVHFGAQRPELERAFLAWLDHAAGTASWIVVNGDLFDFWFEFRAGIPKGYEHLLARLREIVGSGVPVTLTGGNHDWWGGRYLREEIGLEFLQEAVTRDIAGHTTLLAHGDGLGEGDLGYRLVLRPLLRSLPFRAAFGMLPIPVGDRIAGRVSRTEDRWDEWGADRARRAEALEEWAVRELRARPELDLVLLGHTHQPVAKEVAPNRWYVNSGDWVFHKSYVKLEAGAPPVLTEWDGQPR